MSSRRLFYSNNGSSGTVLSARVVPGAYGPLGGISSFSRADATTCATQFDVNSVAQTVLANILRDGHYIGGFPTILLEPARVQGALGSCSFADGTYWPGQANWTISTATSCIAGQTAYRHLNTNLGAAFVRYQNVGVFVNGQTDCYTWIVENVDAVTTAFEVYDVTSASVYVATFTWATTSIATTSGTGTCGSKSLGNGRYAIWVTATGTAAGAGGVGHTRRDVCYCTGLGQNAQTLIIHAGVFEANAAFPTSPVVTVAAGVTRAVDALVLAGVPFAGTLFYHYFDLATNAWADAVAVYTASTAITPPVARAYQTIAVIAGTRTVAQCKAILGGTFP